MSAAKDLYLEREFDLFALYGTILLAKIDAEFRPIPIAIQLAPSYQGPEDIDERFMQLVDDTAAALAAA